MEHPPPAPPRLVLDHGVLAPLTEAHGRADWLQSGRQAGLLSLRPEAGDGPPELASLLRELARWPDETAPVASARSWLPWLAGSAGALVGLGFRSVPLALVLAVAFAAAARWAGAGRPSRPTPAARAAVLLRSLLGRSFVAVVGETVVENAPHLDYLRERRQGLQRARERALARRAEVQATLAGIRQVNARLGEPEEDGETRQLSSTDTTIDAELSRLAALDARLEREEQRVRSELAAHRLLAERQALSRRAARLAEVEAPALGHLVASVELDVAGIERSLAGTAEALREDDARLRAVLEVARSGG